MTQSNEIGKIISVKKLLQEDNLTIPDYQRPYKWTTRHVNQLLTDIAIAHQRKKTTYRLGTVVFHAENIKDNKGSTVVIKNIVDGQQRTITFMLIVLALIKTRVKELERADVKKCLEEFELATWNKFTFSSTVSQNNIYNNYNEIYRIVSKSEFDEDLIYFLLYRCELVSFTLDEISEAFQFFDSQNARGRDLKPHDLLKAYHLRAFSKVDEDVKSQTVHAWENSNDEDLAVLFAEYLYRVRKWSMGQPARYFTKEDIPLFKGVNLDTTENYPYMQSLKIAHCFVDDYNSHYTRRVDSLRMSFPFRLDQTVINGRRFFEMVSHYQEQGFHLDRKTILPVETTLDNQANEIWNAITTYEGRHRSGDIYVRNLFDCLLMYYHDKFGTAEISRAIEKIFIWSYKLRITSSAVQLASVDKYVREENLFVLVRDAIRPENFIHCYLPVLSNSMVSNILYIEKIKKQFQNMGYLN